MNRVLGNKSEVMIKPWSGTPLWCFWLNGLVVLLLPGCARVLSRPDFIPFFSLSCILHTFPCNIHGMTSIMHNMDQFINYLSQVTCHLTPLTMPGRQQHIARGLRAPRNNSNGEIKTYARGTPVANALAARETGARKPSGTPRPASLASRPIAFSSPCSNSQYGRSSQIRQVQTSDKESQLAILGMKAIST